MKSKTGARVEIANHRLLAFCSLPELLGNKMKINNCYFHCLFRKKIRYITEVSYSPLKVKVDVNP